MDTIDGDTEIITNEANIIIAVNAISMLNGIDIVKIAPAINVDSPFVIIAPEIERLTFSQKTLIACIIVFHQLILYT